MMDIMKRSVQGGVQVGDGHHGEILVNKLFTVELYTPPISTCVRDVEFLIQDTSSAGHKTTILWTDLSVTIFLACF